MGSTSVFTNDKPSEIVCTVRKNRILVTTDGRTMVDWIGAPNRLSVHPIWSVPDKQALYIGTYHSAFHITKLELTPITGEGKKLE